MIEYDSVIQHDSTNTILLLTLYFLELILFGNLLYKYSFCWFSKFAIFKF